MADAEVVELSADVADIKMVTPSQSEAMSYAPSKPKPVAVTQSGGMPVHAKLAHALAIIVAGVIAVAVGIVLADGTSVIKLKEAQYLPIITNPALKSQGFSHRIDMLLGPTYGVGLHHDQAGYTWTDVSAGKTLKELERDLGLPVIVAALPSVIATDDLKHPVPFLECNELQMAGLAAVSLGFIAEIVAVVMLIFHTLALAGLLPSKLAKPLGGLIWFVLATGFLVVIFLAVGVYSATWECDNTIIPSINLSDHFEYSYGFAFAITGFVSALLIFLVICAVTSTSDDTGSSSPPSLCMLIAVVLCGLTLGLIIAAFGGMFIAAANGAYTNDPVDDSINPCEGKKPSHAYNTYSGPGDSYFSNVDCMRDNVAQVLEQAGGNVTRGYRGGLDAADREPITGEYSDHGLCPVNVHWHLGAEHLSVGEFDEHGHGPSSDSSGSSRRNLAAGARLGFQCHHYDASDEKFTTPYNWQHCVDMVVGQTYEIHWPHSAAGACGTQWQYQSPFYDGVFCRDGIVTIAPLNTYEKIGVQSQVFTIVNDEAYYNANLMDGAIVDASSNKWQDVGKYTGSTTGTSRDNVVCSRYTPITWQVDRKCHLISASSFDKLCRDMGTKRDDMSGDFHPHGARALVATHLVADNQQSRKK